MKRIISFLLLASLLASVAVAQKVTLKISTQSVPDDWHTKALHEFKDYLDQNAPDMFDVQIFDNGQLFAGDAEVSALQRGNLEMAYVSAQTLNQLGFTDVSPLTAGYVVQSPEQLCSIWTSDLGQDWKTQIEAKYGLHLLDDLYLGTREINLRTSAKVMTPADLKGIKLRMPPSEAWLFLGRALGATPTPLPFAEVYLGLQTGTIDAQDNPLPTVKAAKFYEVTKQIVMTDHLVDGVILTVSGRTWDKLTDEQKGYVEGASHAALMYNNSKRVEDEAQLVAFFKEKGLDVYAPDLTAFREHVLGEYQGSKFAETWPDGIIATLDAVPTDPRCEFR